MKAFKWGVLAPGRIANSFAQGLAVIKDATPWAVGSRDLGRAKAFADQYGFVKPYGSYEELAKDSDVDAIYVATPHPMHEAAVLTCLDHGKAVLCEKPFAVNHKQAENMVNRARENKVFLMEAMWTRFLPAVRKAVSLVEASAIGKVRHVSADFGFRTDIDPTGRLFAPQMAGGSLLDVGVYNLAFCSMTLKKQPDNIVSHLQLGQTGVDEVATAMLQYDGGATAFVLSAIRLNTRHEAVIYGEQGHIRLPSYWNSTKVILNNHEGEQVFDLPYESSGFQFEAMEVMACMRSGKTESPLMPLDETLALAATMDKIRRDNDLIYPFEEGYN